MSDRYYARSAGKKTDEWTVWFVADRTKGGLNVTNELFKKIFPEQWKAGAVFTSKEWAEDLAQKANEVLQ